MINLPTNQLLEEFAAGKHIPGAGSAVALSGLLSCALIQTVIKITREHKERKNQEIDPKLQEIETEIDKIKPSLEEAFQRDADQFDRVFQARSMRDRVKNQDLGCCLQRMNLEALKGATETVLEIANLCVELAEYGEGIFEKGYRAVRGDASVANNSATSGALSALAVVNLNLGCYRDVLWWEDGDWLAGVMQKADFLKRRLNKAQSRAGDVLRKLQEEKSLRSMKYDYKPSARFSDKQIEDIAISLQDVIDNLNQSTNERRMMPALDAFRLFKYEVHDKEPLGEHNQQEVAGLIDKKEYRVYISSQFSSPIRNFTAAHELGHALLHNISGLHRDRPLDGSRTQKRRNHIEQEADKFAACFLMSPERVRRSFKAIFLTDKFVINEATTFALSSGESSEGLRRKVRNLRGLTKLLAGCKSYNYRHYEFSLADFFNVSVEAMAIRLEELRLVEF